MDQLPQTQPGPGFTSKVFAVLCCVAAVAIITSFSLPAGKLNEATLLVFFAGALLRGKAWGWYGLVAVVGLLTGLSASGAKLDEPASLGIPTIGVLLLLLAFLDVPWKWPQIPDTAAPTALADPEVAEARVFAALVTQPYRANDGETAAGVAIAAAETTTPDRAPAIVPELTAAEKTCPYCAETIRAEAVKCRYCGEWLTGERQQV